MRRVVVVPSHQRIRKEPSRLDHPGVSIGVVVLMAVFGAADNHYYRKLAPNTPRYSGTTKKLTRMLTKKLTKKKEEGIPHYTSEVTPPPSLNTEL